MKMPFDMRLLEQRCLSSIEQYAEEFGHLTDTGKPNGRYIYLDRGSPVLFVAHLDTVNQYDHFNPMQIAGETYLFNAQLDDRLGAYIGLDLLPSMGIVPDVLLTEGEEVGQSSAAHFEPPEGKSWNWMFQFDRTGTDVVMYQYEDKRTRAAVEGYGMKVATGSVSDIRYLERLKIKGFNFGTGYYNNHSKLAYAILDDTWYMVTHFVHFWEGLVEVPFPHEPKSWGSAHWYPTRQGHYHYRGQGAWEGNEQDDWYARQSKARATGPSWETGASQVAEAGAPTPASGAGGTGLLGGTNVGQIPLLPPAMPIDHVLPDGVYCPTCRFEVPEEQFLDRYGMCQFCYGDLRQTLESGQPYYPGENAAARGA